MSFVPYGVPGRWCHSLETSVPHPTTHGSAHGRERDAFDFALPPAAAEPRGVLETTKAVAIDRLVWSDDQQHGQIRRLSADLVLTYRASLRLLPLKQLVRVVLVPEDPTGMNLPSKSPVRSG